MIEIPDDIKVLSVRQPWAWALFHGKDIENRNQKTLKREWVLIHAGKQPAFKLTPAARADFKLRYGLTIPEHLPYHGIVGMARIVACVTESASKWWMGPYGYVMADAIEFPTSRHPEGILLPFIECDGALSFLPAGPQEIAAVRRYLAKMAG